VTKNNFYTKRNQTKEIYLRGIEYLHWPVHIYVWKQGLPDSSQEFSVEYQDLLFHSWRALSTGKKESKQEKNR
jgi:hypothetical protein